MSSLVLPFPCSDSSVICTVLREEKAKRHKVIRVQGGNGLSRIHTYLFIFIFIYFYLIFLAVLCGLWDLSSPTRYRTWALAVKVPSPNHWTARKFPLFLFKCLSNFLNHWLFFLRDLRFSTLLTYEFKKEEQVSESY